jgi:hypothetical protein
LLLDTHASPFWKEVLWAAKATQMSIMWKIGNGKRFASRRITSFGIQVSLFNIGLCILLMSNMEKL